VDVNVPHLLQNSKERIRKIDTERKLIEKKEGRVEPELESMKLGEAREFRLGVIHVDINGFKEIIQEGCAVSTRNGLIKIFVVILVALVTSFILAKLIK